MCRPLLGAHPASLTAGWPSRQAGDPIATGALTMTVVSVIVLVLIVVLVLVLVSVLVVVVLPLVLLVSLVSL